MVTLAVECYEYHTPGMSKKLHFHTLDSTRFFAFLLVFCLHLNIGYDHPLLRFLTSRGALGVAYFFVLSGFLITYILVSEKKTEGKIDLEKFFIRRCFRIWPLYFIVVTASYIVFYYFPAYVDVQRQDRYLPDWRYSYTFLENYKMIFTHKSPAIASLTAFWSLCIEEHFYIIWMLLISIISVKNLPLTFMICIVFANCYRYFVPPLLHTTIINMRDVFAYMDFFAAGALVGYFAAVKYEKIVKFINSIPVCYKPLYVVFAVVFMFSLRYILPSDIYILSVVKGTIIASVFAALIAIFIPVNSKFKMSDSNPFIYLGKISYGLYVYHIIILQIVLRLIVKTHLSTDNLYILLPFGIISLALTILVAHLSYKYIETPFFRLRDRLYQG